MTLLERAILLPLLAPLIYVSWKTPRPTTREVAR
jgi:hypothetical protein